MKQNGTYGASNMKRLTKYQIVKNGRVAYTVKTRRIANRIAARMTGDVEVQAIAAR